MKLDRTICAGMNIKGFLQLCPCCSKLCLEYQVDEYVYYFLRVQMPQHILSRLNGCDFHLHNDYWKGIYYILNKCGVDE